LGFLLNGKVIEALYESVNFFTIHHTIISRHLHAKERFAFAHKFYAKMCT